MSQEVTRGRNQFKKVKRILMLISLFYRILPLRMRKKALERHRYTGGKIGIGLRYAILKSISNSIGDNVAIFQDVYINNPENIVIGDNVSIHQMSYLECGYSENGITIGNDVSIAHGVTIMATTHLFDNKEMNIKDQGVITEKIEIQDNVWLGAKSVVLSGTTIRKGNIIGASAVVTKTTEPYGIYVGIPARRIRDR